jgi:hypothetical protein
LATTLVYTRYFLDYELKGLGNWASFLDSLSGNSDINYQVSCPQVGTAEIQPHQDLQIFPNPASKVVQLSYTGASLMDYEVHVINIYGQTVQNSCYNAGTTSTISLDVSTLARGSYQVILETKEHELFRKLLILQ